ncbi:hypothetical protein C8R47DRAFT_1202066 [Mycena vitilis]|nr:hypothetical protein C8R47DRAFT_1202066 [Mycena vitilis]
MVAFWSATNIGLEARRSVRPKIVIKPKSKTTRTLSNIRALQDPLTKLFNILRLTAGVSSAAARDDIATDGSHIEASHKGWNSLQCSVASGLELQTALGHDFNVLRRNLWVGHHLALVDAAAASWTTLLPVSKANSSLVPLPRLKDVNSGETFGLVNSRNTDTFGGLYNIKTEPEDDLQLVDELNSEEQSELMQELDLDPVSFLQPMPSGISTDLSLSENTAVSDVDVPSRTASLPGSSSSSRGTKRKNCTENTPGPLSLPQENPGVSPDEGPDGKKQRIDPPPCALKIGDGAEFFLLMNMRAEFQWKSCEMTPKRWVEATVEYNARLQTAAGSSEVVKKHPRALMEKLGEIEPKLIQQIANNNFKCERIVAANTVDLLDLISGEEGHSVLV